MYELQGSIMTRGQVNVTVSALQVALAVFLWWYAPLQVRETQEAAKAQYPNQHIQLGLDFYRRIEPGPAERVAFALNFPALILSIPVANFFPEPLYESYLRLFSPMDLAFFVSYLWSLSYRCHCFGRNSIIWFKKIMICNAHDVLVS